MDRRLFIVIAVLGFHALGLWALQTGLLRRAVELVVPVEVLAEMIEPPQPQVTPAPPRPSPQPAPVQKSVVQPRPVAPPAPLPVAVIDPTPAPQAPAGLVEPQPSALPAPVAVADPAPAPPAPAAPARVELPSSNADYLNNTPPAYPPLSKRLGEQGKVVVRAYIEINGTASKAEVRSSSGYDRLDQVALQTVLKWRYVPGKRAGVPEAMWFNVPINFILD
jgi:protein TonB